MSDPIKAALEAADRETTTAGKIAAFLRVLHASRPPRTCWFPGELAAVERAAKEGGE